MQYEIDPDFQRKLDDFNASAAAPSNIEIAYNVKRKRWQVYAVLKYPPQDRKTAQLLRDFPDGSGRRGALIMTWAQRNLKGDDVGFMPMDERLLQALKFSYIEDKHDYDRKLTEPELARMGRESKHLYDVAAASREYYRGLDSLTINMGASNHGTGSWRHRIR